jgi:hypothetical protein
MGGPGQGPLMIHLIIGIRGVLYVVYTGIIRRFISYMCVIHNIKCCKHNIMCETNNRG